MILPLIVLALYFVLLFILIYGWHKQDSFDYVSTVNVVPTMVSVVIAVRNEENTILNLLQSLNNQSYDLSMYEVIVINDFSTDATETIVEQYKKEASYTLLLEQNKKSDSPKKQAIELAVSKAKGKLILVTDGDCDVSPTWISTHVNAYEQTGAYFVAAPVKIKVNKNSLFERMQQLEFSSLLASGAASLKLGFPSMANAANMSFSKKVFQEIGGYSGTGNTPSGDDELLMHKIAINYPNKLFFIQQTEAIVTTKALTSVKAFINQRKRWGSKWKYYQLPYIKILAFFIFLVQLSIISLLLLCFFNKINILFVLSFLIIRLILEFFFLKPVTKFLGISFSYPSYLLLQIIYPFYVVIVGVLANFGHFVWKDRKY